MTLRQQTTASLAMALNDISPAIHNSPLSTCQYEWVLGITIGFICTDYRVYNPISHKQLCTIALHKLDLANVTGV